MEIHKAHLLWEGSTLHLSVCTVDESKVEISQNFVAFSENTNFTILKVNQTYVHSKYVFLHLQFEIFNVEP